VLVGSIDLDDFGPRCEHALQTSNAGANLERLRRLWPRTFVTYLVWQGLHNYEAATFWSKVSIAALRNGQDVGHEYELALRNLGLPVFDDLEAQEGFSKHTKNRYIRRIHIHGGIPKDSLPRVFDLVAATLRRVGARSADEVLDVWLASDVMRSLPVAAARVLAYTGDFGVSLIELLVDLLREGGRSGDLSRVGAPSHFEEAARHYLSAGPSGHDWEFKAGAAIRLDPFSGLGPFLLVPTGSWAEWSVDGVEKGHGSRQAEMRFPIAPPAKPLGWTVTSDEGSRRHFPLLGDVDVIALFDAQGRLHRRGRTLRGLRAYAICPAGGTVTGEVERMALGGEWRGYELVTVDLRGLDALTIATANESSSTSVDTTFHIRLVGEQTRGLTYGGLPVLGRRVGFAIDGLTPDPEQVTVLVSARATVLEPSLADLDDRDGTYNLDRLFDWPFAAPVEVDVRIADKASTSVAFAWLPDVAIEVPTIAGPDEPYDAVLRLPEGWQGPPTVLFEPGVIRQAAGLVTYDGDDVLVHASLNRLFWAVENVDDPVQVVGGEPIALHADDLPGRSLRLRCVGVTPRLVVTGGVEQAVWLRTRHSGADTVRVSLGAFADTVRSAQAARCEVWVDTGEGTDGVLLGHIESRFEPIGLDVAVETDANRSSISASWQEMTEWDKRELRLWSAATDAIVVTQPVVPGRATAEVMVEDLSPGRYVVEVTRASGWGAPRRPGIGPSAVAVHLGSEVAGRLRTAVEEADLRARFGQAELDELVPFLADLLHEFLPDGGLPEQRRVVTNLVLDDTHRAVDVIVELADQLEIDDFGRGAHLLEPVLLPLLPYLFDVPLRAAGSTAEEHDRLTSLWSVAPVAAACVDAAATEGDADSAERWRYATGQAPAGRNPNTVRDKLARGIPSLLVHFDDLPLPLAPAGWTQALIELRDASARTSQVRLGIQARELVRRLGQAPQWSGVALRVRRAATGAGLGSDWLADLSAIACAYLDLSTSPDLHRQILPLLLETHVFAPHAVRSSVVLAAGSMRALERLH